MRIAPRLLSALTSKIRRRSAAPARLPELPARTCCEYAPRVTASHRESPAPQKFRPAATPDKFPRNARSCVSTDRKWCSTSTAIAPLNVLVCKRQEPTRRPAQRSPPLRPRLCNRKCHAEFMAILEAGHSPRAPRQFGGSRARPRADFQHVVAETRSLQQPRQPFPPA